MNQLKSIQKDLQSLQNPQQAKNLQRFFKTAKGEYGEGDRFLGLKVGQVRQIAQKYVDLSLKDLQKLLKSEIHEHRFAAVVILTHQLQKGNQVKPKEIAQFYLKNAQRFNNWDLVDLSAPKILGPYLLDRDRSILYQLAQSKNLWERRIAIMSTAAFINQNQFTDTLKIAQILLQDNHDLIHKAVGWMLREVGKKDPTILERFLQQHASLMPRTMLRSAIEKFSEKKRKFYLLKK